MRFWTEQEEQTLRELAEDGMKDREVAAILNRTRPAVYFKRKELGIINNNRGGTENLDRRHHIIDVLNKQGAMPVRKLAKIVQINSGGLGKLLKRMTKDKLLTRKVSDKGWVHYVPNNMRNRFDTNDEVI